MPKPSSWNEIDFTPYEALLGRGGNLHVQWRLGVKTGRVEASALGLGDEDLFRHALDTEALEVFVNTLFWQQAGPARSEIWGFGISYYGSHLALPIVEPLAQGIALHYLVALQRMIAVDEALGARTYDAYLLRRDVVRALRQDPDGSTRVHEKPLVLAHRALQVLRGEKRPNQRGGRGWRYELVPTAYRCWAMDYAARHHQQENVS